MVCNLSKLNVSFIFIPLIYTVLLFFCLGFVVTSIRARFSNETIPGKQRASLYRPVGQFSIWSIRVIHSKAKSWVLLLRGRTTQRASSRFRAAIFCSCCTCSEWKYGGSRSSLLSLWITWICVTVVPASMAWNNWGGTRALLVYSKVRIVRLIQRYGS